MKKHLIALTIISVSVPAFCQWNINDIRKKVETVTVKPLTEGEIANGLKEALRIGSQNASRQLNAVDGFNRNSLVRIPFPPDAKMVADRLRQLGMGRKVDEFELIMNRAAEQAAKEAGQIFVNSISQMTISDARNILNGPDNAATQFLQRTSTSQLTNAFRPHIERALANTLATKYWTELTTYYNRLPGVRPVNTNLVNYTNERAISGMFVVVAAEELKIRKDPDARVTDILRRVFGQK
ncbi:MAG: DUF4197 domain-containing protein [Cytophagales bacterium]